jgi:hypothetical protein
VRKALDMIRKIADAQKAAEDEEKDEDGEKKGMYTLLTTCAVVFTAAKPCNRRLCGWLLQLPIRSLLNVLPCRL